MRRSCRRPLRERDRYSFAHWISRNLLNLWSFDPTVVIWDFSLENFLAKSLKAIICVSWNWRQANSHIRSQELNLHNLNSTPRLFKLNLFGSWISLEMSLWIRIGWRSVYAGNLYINYNFINKLLVIIISSIIIIKALPISRLIAPLGSTVQYWWCYV